MLRIFEAVALEVVEGGCDFDHARLLGVMPDSKIAPVNAHRIVITQPVGEVIALLFGGFSGCRADLKMEAPAKFQTLIDHSMWARFWNAWFFSHAVSNA
jgi:hypothetical protein